MNPIEKMKAAAKEGWSTFAPFESFTGSAAPHLVRFAGINKGDRVLDIGCGTGVLTLTVARAGGIVTGADLTPQLLERARENARGDSERTDPRFETRWDLGVFNLATRTDVGAHVQAVGYLWASTPTRGLTTLAVG